MKGFGVVRNPITCPVCNVVTAVPMDGRMWLTEAAAGFYPSGYRCQVHARGREVTPQPKDAPQRLPRMVRAA